MDDQYDLFNRDTGQTLTLREQDCIKIFGVKEWAEIKQVGYDGQYVVSKHVEEPPPPKFPDLGL